MGRISIRVVMAVVLVSALGLAALRNANEVWAKVLMMLAVALLGVAVLWAILLRGWERAWWSGFAVLGIAYLLVSFSPLRSRLGTTQLMEYVHSRVAPLAIATIEVSRFDENSVLYKIVTSDGDVSERTVPLSVYTSNTPLDLQISMLPATNRWRSVLPGAENLDAFERVGHAASALLAGLVGGTVGFGLWRWKQRAAAAPGSQPHASG